MPKTTCMKRNDDTRIREFDRKIELLSQQLYQKKKGTTNLDVEIEQLKKDLELKDSKSLITITTWSVDQPCRTYKQDFDFDLTSEWEIVSVRKWDTTWQIIRQPYRVHGTVQGEFMQDLHASVTLETERRIRYADDIARIKREITEKKAERARVAEKMHYNNKTELAIKAYRQEKEEFIKNNMMTLEQAKRCL